MNAPYFVRLPSGTFLNLSNVLYVADGAAVFGFDTAGLPIVDDATEDDRDALRAWLDRAAIQLDAPAEPQDDDTPF